MDFGGLLYGFWQTELGFQVLLFDRRLSLKSHHLRILDEALLPTSVPFQQLKELSLLQYLAGQQTYDLRIDVLIVDAEVGRLLLEYFVCPLLAVALRRVEPLQLLGQVLGHCDVLCVLIVPAKENVQVVEQLLLLLHKVVLLFSLVLLVVE